MDKFLIRTFWSVGPNSGGWYVLDDGRFIRCHPTSFCNTVGKFELTDNSELKEEEKIKLIMTY